MFGVTVNATAARAAGVVPANRASAKNQRFKERIFIDVFADVVFHDGTADFRVRRLDGPTQTIPVANRSTLKNE